ncbi:hypothetical protein Scep_001463 [Stephania cephalantha]|uniref:Uncharacterized protein n=1 Tax=Stephania cephalantha TaxID=152367 RepID=A0AAP0L7Y8_9MAGN
MYMSTSACPRGPTWTCTLIAPSAKALSVSTWTRKGFPVHVDPRGPGKPVTWGAIAPSQKALSAPHCRLPETDAENLCVGFAFPGGWERSVERDTEEGGRRKAAHLREFRVAVCIRAAETEERRCGGVTEQGAAAFHLAAAMVRGGKRGGGAWRKNAMTAARRRRRRISGGAERRRSASAPYTQRIRRWSGRRR